MSNTFGYTSSNPDLAIKMFGEALKNCREEMALAKFCKNTNYGGYFDKPGQDVYIPIPQAWSDEASTTGVYPPAASALTIPTTSIKADQWRRTPHIAITAQEMKYYELNGVVPMQVGEGVRGLVRTFNQYLHSFYWRTNVFYGTASATPFGTNINALSDLGKVMTAGLCPPRDRHLFLSLAQAALLRKTDDFKKNPQMAGEEGYKRLQSGEMGYNLGFNCMEDRDVKSHTVGTITATVSCATAAVGAVAVTLTASSAGAVALKKGDIVMFSGSFTGGTYAVQADCTIAGSASGSLTIWPPLVTAVASGDAVALATDASGAVFGSAVNHLACDPYAFGVVAGILDQPDMAVQRWAIRDDSDPAAGYVGTGLPFLFREYAEYNQRALEVSFLYGAQLIDTRRAARFLAAV